MLVYHVWKKVQPGALCSYPAGLTWLQSVDTEAEAVEVVERNNRHRFAADIGISYICSGPQEETEIPEAI